VGSLPVRAGRQFESGRKLGKTHQQLLVFLKGDARRAVQAIGPVEFGEIEEAAQDGPGADGAAIPPADAPRPPVASPAVKTTPPPGIEGDRVPVKISAKSRGLM